MSDRRTPPASKPAARGTAADAHRMPISLREVGPALLRTINGALLRYPNGSYMTDLPTDRTVLTRLGELSENELRWIRSGATTLMALATEELSHRGAPATPAPTNLTPLPPREFDTDGDLA